MVNTSALQVLGSSSPGPATAVFTQMNEHFTNREFLGLLLPAQSFFMKSVKKEIH